MFGFMFPTPTSGSSLGSGPSASEVRVIAEGPTKELKNRVESLELACASLWELLKAKNGYTDEELVAMIREVDLRDGKLDGRMSKAAVDCSSCGRKLLSRKSPNCHWCGTAIPKGNF